MKKFKAMVWMEGESVGKRLTLLADTLEEARLKLRKEYGLAATISIRNEDDADRPRIPK